MLDKLKMREVKVMRVYIQGPLYLALHTPQQIETAAETKISAETEQKD